MLQGGEKVSELQAFLNDVYGKFNAELDAEVILARMLEAISDATSPFYLDDSYHSILSLIHI